MSIDLSFMSTCFFALLAGTVFGLAMLIFLSNIWYGVLLQGFVLVQHSTLILGGKPATAEF